jgi:hypothetical protein
MPKGGRKGGATFPRYTLDEALGWAKKLVSKTHLGPQSEDIIHSGVVGSKSGTARVRVSSLKQYGLLTGSSSAYVASELAKRIVAAPPDEVKALYTGAVLHAAVFKGLFNTFHGDSVTKPKLKQRAADLNVDPEETDTCVDIYVSSMSTAGLVSIQGDKILHLSATEDLETKESNTGPPADLVQESGTKKDSADKEPADDGAGLSPSEPSVHRPRAVFNVSVTLDSSLDIEKLAKQLELLKRFGAI